MNHLILIPLLPLVGFLINGLFGSRLPRWLVSVIACGLPVASFALALSAFNLLRTTGLPVTDELFTWVGTANFKIDVALYFDQIAAVMCLVVTGVGSLIHIYSIGYMSHDKSYSRYFAYLNLFLFFMLMLVLGKNLIILFAGWEGVGIASYLLIGFWFEDREKTAAGLKAFVVNRVGDTGFILAAFLIFFFTKTLDFQQINSVLAVSPPSLLILNTIGILLLIGACGKSAQIPLHVWLPDAMAGPTPVSALIHAATMVTAGVYLLSRMSGLFLHAPMAMNVVAWLGALTAIVGATMGITQYNIKKVLAYSTMSQIGYMFMACGLGAFDAGLFHLYTHAFFKACLFLGAGAIIHALHGEEDMRKMGALWRKIPLTFGTFLVASAALSGIPPFAGFFSKDEILWNAWSAPNGSPYIWAVGWVAAGMTAFYMTRAIIMTFFGQSNVPEKLEAGIHEAPPSMSIILVILAIASLAAGFIGTQFFGFLAPVLGHHAAEEAAAGHSMEMILMGASIAIAFGGIILGCFFYLGKRTLADKAKEAAGPVYRLVCNGYYFDAFYNNVVVRCADWISETVLAKMMENVFNFVAIELPSGGISMFSRLFSSLQTGNVQAYVLYVLLGLALILWWGVAHA